MRISDWSSDVCSSDLYFANTAGLPESKRIDQGYKPDEDWDQPMFTVFTQDGDTVRHFWSTELVYVPEETGQNHRAEDLVDPLWTLLDMTTEGRGTDGFPKEIGRESGRERGLPSG